MAGVDHPGLDPISRRSHYLRIAMIAIGVLAVVAWVFVGVSGIVARWDGDATTIHDLASLPARINVCGRARSKDALDRQFTLGEARAMGGAAPVVATGPFAPCPVGPCGLVGGAACDTVIFVRVGQDAYFDYSLVGCP